jgi:hypothetical protein
MSQLTRYVYRILFVIAFLMAGFALWEKYANMLGYTVLRGVMQPGRLLQAAGLAAILTIALLLREIRDALVSKGPA